MADEAVKNQIARVNEAMMAFRRETTQYKRLAKAPPTFLLDGKAERLNDAALHDAKLYADRFAMMRALLKGGVGGEVGVQQGVFSKFILREIEPDTLYLFDFKAAPIDEGVLADPRVRFLPGDSSAQIATLPDRSLDWIYIDGDHSRDGVAKDLDAARQKVKAGGTIIFNDYTLWSVGEVMPYGVMSVVNAFVNQGNPVLGFAIAPHGYHDIAVSVQAA